MTGLQHYIVKAALISPRHMATTVIARIDFGNVGIRLYEPAFGQNMDDDDGLYYLISCTK